MKRWRNFIRAMKPEKKQPYGNARNERDIVSQINSLYKSLVADSTAEEAEHLITFGLLSNNSTYM